VLYINPLPPVIYEYWQYLYGRIISTEGEVWVSKLAEPRHFL